MGQYYHGVILKQNFRTSYKNEEAEVILSPHDYGMGLKLMETAWWKNPYIAIYEEFLANQFYGYPFVWCGDYADDFRMTIENLNKDEFIQKYGKDEYVPYHWIGKINKAELPTETGKYRYIVNLSKKKYVDLSKLNDNEEQWAIHPLPLLCASGNGRGGGDFWGVDLNVGRWAYDNIGMGNEVPEGCTELEVHFSED